MRKRTAHASRKFKTWNVQSKRVNNNTSSWKDYKSTFITVASVFVGITALIQVYFYYTQSPIPIPVLTDPETERPPSPSILHKYKKGAVSSDGVPCSRIGKNILKKHGSAVDAAIATLFCNGIVNLEAMGIGGGMIMTVYIRSQRKAYGIIARENAPLAAHRDMFSDSRGESLYEPSRTGSRAIGVPGELKGYWEAWRKFGRLPWKTLVAPSIELCYRGYELSKPQRDALKFRPETPKLDPNLRTWFIDNTTSDYKKLGTAIVPFKLCKTYERIAEEGGMALHSGSLTKIFVEDVQYLGSVLTEQDMNGYRVDWREPLSIRLGNDTLFTAPPPASGAILAHILQILKGYNFSRESLSSVPKSISSIHRIAEAFKFAFAKRGLLGDPNFADISTVLKELTSESYAEEIRKQIDDNTTFSDFSHYGAVEFRSTNHGTNHVSVLSGDGDAVAVTSSINLYFGAGFTSRRTGIVLNSVMDDFSIPDVTNYFHLLPSAHNFIEPGRKPLSSATPTIIVDKNWDVKLVIGASGGSRIITALAWVITRMLWFGEDLKTAIDASRIHHQLSPMTFSYEYGLLKQIVEGLKQLGHKAERYSVRGSVVCAVAKANGTVFANADFRKFGGVDGLD